MLPHKLMSHKDSQTQFLNYSQSPVPRLWGCLCVFKCFQEFARRALGKINELAKIEEQNEVPTTRETQRAYKEASIKAGDSSLQIILLILLL